MRPLRPFTLETFAAFVAMGMVGDVHEARKIVLKVGAAMIQKEAKDVIGTYTFGWEQLAPDTQAERARLGFPPNQPLLRTGSLRDSIEITIVKPGEEAWIGTNHPVAAFQEFGTSTIPPRPFMGRRVQASTERGNGEAGKTYLGMVCALGVFGDGVEISRSAGLFGGHLL
jgi:HK97 gp10 family phage protein